ncbi:outer membrane beta-barrel protein [Sphingobacterium sp. LRF_L2]|uniref:outer membrane beta-barrel protein n=1 Tax=Sphingobacterium sp. LRF_L2 TaxID=3369421 RepID=UPI003F61B464
MKNLISKNILAAFGLLIIFHANTVAQEVESDSIVNSKNFDLEPTIGKKDYDDDGKQIKYPRIFGGLTFSRIDWGFSRLIDDGSFTLSADNQFLDYKKASNFGFDLAQIGLRFNDILKVYLSTGFEWNYLRLKKNIILDTEATPLSYADSDIQYDKNIFTSTYLRLPLTFELRSRKNRHGDRAKFAFGAMTGILLKGTQRLKSEELGKQKYKDNYNLASFQYGVFARVGFDCVGVFAKYYLNDMFENSPAQANVNNFTFGLTLGF